MDKRLRLPLALAFYALILGGALAAGSFGHSHVNPSHQSQISGRVSPALDVRCGTASGCSVDTTVGSKTVEIQVSRTATQP